MPRQKRLLTKKSFQASFLHETPHKPKKFKRSLNLTALTPKRQATPSQNLGSPKSRKLPSLTPSPAIGIGFKLPSSPTKLTMPKRLFQLTRKTSSRRVFSRPSKVSYINIPYEDSRKNLTQKLGFN